MIIYLKHIWNFLKNNIFLLTIIGSVIIVTTIGYKSLYKRIEINQDHKTYSLIEGTINGEKTYYLIYMDTVNMDINPPYVIINSQHLNKDSTYGRDCSVSLNGLDVLYPKKYKDITPLIEEIKKNSGYEIAGVIGNNIEMIDTIAIK